MLYGASGFVGRQTVAYFARHAPAAVRWAIAGRDRPKLEAVRDEVGASVDVLVADARDRPAVDAMVAGTRVLLTTAGPFARHGDALVDACVRFGTHYVDITGETPWVRSLIDRHHHAAAAAGTRIVPCCGFDSVLSDLGAYLVARRLQRDLGVPCERVNAFYRLRGGLNGGTVASTLFLHDSGAFASLSDPFLLNPPDRRPERPDGRHRDPRTPVLHPDVDAWAAPFSMGVVNTRVVRRSAALGADWREPYGGDFAYLEYLEIDEPLGALKAFGLSAGSAVASAILARSRLRGLLRAALPRPGTGPSEQARDEGWVSCRIVATAADGRQVRGSIRDRGDPSNRVTVKCVCEGALSLLLGADELPGGPGRGGVLTPATAMGDVLVERLREAGMTIEVGSS